MKQRPSLWALLRADTITILVATFPLVLWGAWIGLEFYGPGRSGGDTELVLWLAVLSMSVCVPLVMLRVNAAYHLVHDGEVTEGEVLEVSFEGDSGRIAFAYEWEWEEYVAQRAIHRTHQAEALGPGDEVVVLVDPNRPHNAILPDISS